MTIPELAVHSQNAEQIRYWNDRAGPKWVARQEMLDAQLAPLGARVLDAAALESGDWVLDVGCGCGASSLETIQRIGARGRVVGIDVSAVMLARAQQRARADRVFNLHLLRGDAQTPILLPGRFDALTSRFGVMFFAEPEQAFATLGTALRPEGRLVFVCWQPLALNPWMKLPLAAAAEHLTLPTPPSPVAPGPFAFGDGDRVRRILTTAGFVDVAVEGLEDRLLVAGGSAFDRTVEFVLDLGPLGALLREADQSTRSTVREAVAEVLKPYANSAGVEMPCAVWIVSARRPGNGVRVAPGSSGPKQRSAAAC